MVDSIDHVRVFRPGSALSQSDPSSVVHADVFPGSVCGDSGTDAAVGNIRQLLIGIGRISIRRPRRMLMQRFDDTQKCLCQGNESASSTRASPCWAHCSAWTGASLAALDQSGPLLTQEHDDDLELGMPASNNNCLLA